MLNDHREELDQLAPTGPSRVRLHLVRDEIQKNGDASCKFEMLLCYFLTGAREYIQLTVELWVAEEDGRGNRG